MHDIKKVGTPIILNSIRLEDRIMIDSLDVIVMIQGGKRYENIANLKWKWENMNTFYPDIKQIILSLEQQDKTKYYLMPGEKILYHAVLPDGRSKCICTPRSKFHESINGYWVDITSVQKYILDNSDVAVVVYLLEGMRIAVMDWGILGPALTIDNMQYNDREGSHWKTYIIKGTLEIRQGPKFTLKIMHLYKRGVTGFVF